MSINRKNDKIRWIKKVSWNTCCAERPLIHQNCYVIWSHVARKDLLDALMKLLKVADKHLGDQGWSEQRSICVLAKAAIGLKQIMGDGKMESISLQCNPFHVSIIVRSILIGQWSDQKLIFVATWRWIPRSLHNLTTSSCWYLCIRIELESWNVRLALLWVKFHL